MKIVGLFIILQFASCNQDSPDNKEAENATINDTAFSDSNRTEIQINNQTNKNEPNLKEYVFVFRDMANSYSFDYYFVIYENMILLKVAPSPLRNTQSSEVTYYIIENIPNDLIAKGAPFFVQAGDIKPPFLPEQTITFRVDIPLAANGVASTVFFKKGNQALNSWLKELNTYITSEGRQIDRLPSCILSDKRILSEISTNPNDLSGPSSNQ